MTQEYIKKVPVNLEPVDYEWNDKFPALKFSRQVPATVKELSKISTKGVVALAAATSEWIVWRLSKASDDPKPGQCIEAVWASISDWKNFKAGFAERIRSEKWTGPTRGALYMMMNLLEGTVENASEYNGAYLTNTVDLFNLFQYITKDTKAFVKWRRDAVKRLQKLFPAEEKNTGKPVPPEALDISKEFDANQAETLSKKFLQSLNKNNPFLKI